MPFLTTLTGPGIAFDTQSWNHGVAAASSWASGGASIGKPNAAPFGIDLRSGASTVLLLGSILRGTSPGDVEVTGCSAPSCTQKITLTDVFPTKVSLGSPLLTDADELIFKSIAWDRTVGQDVVHSGWNLVTGTSF